MKINSYYVTSDDQPDTEVDYGVEVGRLVDPLGPSEYVGAVNVYEEWGSGQSVAPITVDQAKGLRAALDRLITECDVPTGPKRPVQVGDRVKMVGVMPEDPDPIAVGTTGTVRWVNEATMVGRPTPEIIQIDVKWDNGRTLMLLPADPFEVITEEGK